MPGRSSAGPGWGSAVPPVPRRQPSASGSAETPPPAASAPCRQPALSTPPQGTVTRSGAPSLLCPPSGLGPRQMPAPHVRAHVLPHALRLGDLQLLEDLRRQEGRELPPLIRKDPAMPGEGSRAPAPLLRSRFCLGFPWGGKDRSASLPLPSPPNTSLGPGWGPSSPKRNRRLTQRRRDGLDPLQALLRQLQHLRGVGGDPLTPICGNGQGVRVTEGGTPGPPPPRACRKHCGRGWGSGHGGVGGGGSCPTCPCRILLQGLGDEGDALQVLHVGLLPDRWWGGRKR